MMDRRGPPPGRGGGSFLSSKIDEKRRMQESLSTHRTGLPDRLLRLFEARPPVQPVPPPERPPPKQPLSGIATYVEQFAAPGDPEYEPAPKQALPEEPRIFKNPELAFQARVEQETRPEKSIRLGEERAAAAKAAADEAAASWAPARDPHAEGDPFRTLFVGRLSYDTTERKLRREFEEYGPIRHIRIVHDKNSGKPRGYAFIEYEHKSDMKQAYKMAEGRKVEGRRVLVDVERGRTVPSWRPRRLGGGKGGESRAPRPPKDLKKAFVKRLIDKALAERNQRKAEKERAEAPPPREDGEAPPRERREGRERERTRSRSRRGRAESPEEGERRDDDRRGSRPDRERQGRERERDDRKRERSPRRHSEDDRGKRPRERDLL